jgi:hypothetical protein
MWVSVALIATLILFFGNARGFFSLLARKRGPARNTRPLHGQQRVLELHKR